MFYSLHKYFYLIWWGVFCWMTEGFSIDKTVGNATYSKPQFIYLRIKFHFVFFTHWSNVPNLISVLKQAICHLEFSIFKSNIWTIGNQGTFQGLNYLLNYLLVLYIYIASKIWCQKWKKGFWWAIIKARQVTFDSNQSVTGI